MSELVWLIPLLPLIGFLIIVFFTKSLSKTLASLIASGAVLGSFIISAGIFLQLLNADAGQVSTVYTLFEWIKAGNFSVSISFLVDPLSSLFLLIITGVGFLIHLYSIGYMHEDERSNTFFSYLNLFVFFMLLLVLGSNYLMMFVGWEGVGLCSYLLIGFWFKEHANSNAANKAFIINRIGDLGFLLGMILIFVTFGSLDYLTVFPQAAKFVSNDTVLVTITILLLIGAMGKSAQIPLYTWLPDAMAGPTPVSALIHAATMVTAGIYMIARSNILYTLAPATLQIVGIIGVATALFAAIIGLAQNDIKKVLAYSTVSQLGYMFLALGVGAYSSAIFHVTTHAFFKALLFLGAGSVIHAMHGEQDIRNMGGLRKHVPITYFTFLIGTLAIAGIPPFAGFFSKDEILAHAFVHSPLFYVLGVIGSLLTTFYMFRLLFLTFAGSFRGTTDQAHHLHESPSSMTIPLIVLAILSVVGGFMGIPEVLHGNNALQHFLAPVFSTSNALMPAHTLDHSTELMLMMIVVGLSVVVIGIAWFMYMSKKSVPVSENTSLNPLHNLVYHKFYIDEIYNVLIVKPYYWLSRQFYNILEINVIDFVVNGSGKVLVWGSRNLRYAQGGHIGFYIFIMVISILVILLTNRFI